MFQQVRRKRERERELRRGCVGTLPVGLAYLAVSRVEYS
jgi:hypothetical protein